MDDRYPAGEPPASRPRPQASTAWLVGLLVAATLFLAAGIDVLVRTSRASNTAIQDAAAVCGRAYPLADRAPDTPRSVLVLAVATGLLLLAATACVIAAVALAKRPPVRIALAVLLAPLVAFTLLCGVGGAAIHIAGRKGSVCHHGG